MIEAASTLAFLAGIALTLVGQIYTGRLTVVVVRHSTLRPRGPDGRFLSDRQVVVGAALEAAARETGSFGR